MVESPRFNALRIRLQNAKVDTINDALEEIFDFPSELETIVPTVISKIKAGIYIGDEHLVKLLLSTVNSELYQQVKSQVLRNHWRALDLYKGRYPDKQIEELLCKKLYEIAADDGNPLRSYIVDEMREVGSGEVLPTLEAIFFDLMPSTKTRTIFYELLGTVEQIEAQSRIAFRQKVEIAINKIRKRGFG